MGGVREVCGECSWSAHGVCVECVWSNGSSAAGVWSKGDTRKEVINFNITRGKSVPIGLIGIQMKPGFVAERFFPNLESVRVLRTAYLLKLQIPVGKSIILLYYLFYFIVSIQT